MRENKSGPRAGATRRALTWLGIGPVVLFIAMTSAGCGDESSPADAGVKTDAPMMGPDAPAMGPDAPVMEPDAPSVALDGPVGIDGSSMGIDGPGAAVDTVPFTCKDEKIPAPAAIDVDTVWPCNSYVLNGITAIGSGATLTIAAGSTIYGNSQDTANPAVVVAKRDGRLVAVGTKEHPIVFTSVNPPGSRIPGDGLAGIALLGKARINNGTCQGDPNPATPECEAPGFLQSNIEGMVADDPRGQYGGSDDTHDCGELKYLRVEFAGSLVGPDNELNGITVGACGSKTKLNYLQVHRGFDDGIEFFGGTASMDHVLISGPTDDGLDWDNGWSGKVQFLIVHQGYTKGDKGFEGDNLGGAENALPRSNPEIWNATLIAEPGSARVGMHLREGTFYKLRNFIALNFGGGVLDADAATVIPANDWPANISMESSVLFGGAVGAPDTAKDNDKGFVETTALSDPARMNTTTVDPMLASIAFPTPNYTPLDVAAVSGKATPPAGMDTTATYAGAVKPGDTDPWYAGWTAFPTN